MTDCELRIVRHDGVQLTFGRCAGRLQCFALYDAYEEYDAFASADEQVTRRQFVAVNEAMMARIKFDDWRRFVSPNLVPHLAEVPKDVDLIDSSNGDYATAREAVRGGVHQCFAATRVSLIWQRARSASSSDQGSSPSRIPM